MGLLQDFEVHMVMSKVKSGLGSLNISTVWQDWLWGAIRGIVIGFAGGALIARDHGSILWGPTVLLVLTTLGHYVSNTPPPVTPPWAPTTTVTKP